MRVEEQARRTEENGGAKSARYVHGGERSGTAISETKADPIVIHFNANGSETQFVLQVILS
jgi:hypothetical protein